jgi:hypothetical protein
MPSSTHELGIVATQHDSILSFQTIAASVHGTAAMLPAAFACNVNTSYRLISHVATSLMIGTSYRLISHVANCLLIGTSYRLAFIASQQQPRTAMYSVAGSAASSQACAACCAPAGLLGRFSATSWLISAMKASSGSYSSSSPSAAATAGTAGAASGAGWSCTQHQHATSVRSKQAYSWVFKAQMDRKPQPAFDSFRQPSP